jgi:hypothetical protein
MNALIVIIDIMMLTCAILLYAVGLFIFGFILLVVIIAANINMNGVCFHQLTGGHGLMGDAYTCSKCGESKYEECFPFLWLYKILGRVEE